MNNRLIEFFKNRYAILTIAVLLMAIAVLLKKYQFHPLAIQRAVTQAEKYMRTAEKKINQVFEDTALLQRYIQRSASDFELANLISEDFSLFLYEVRANHVSELKFWSKHTIIPPENIPVFEDGEYLEELDNGHYFVVKKTIKTQQTNLIGVALVPVQSKYFIETNYLPTEFYFGNNLERYVQIIDLPTEYPVYTTNGEVLFYFQKIPGSFITGHSTWILFLQTVSLFLFFLLLHLYVESVTKRKGVWMGIFILFWVLLAFRLITYWFPNIFHLSDLELFDPNIYGANSIHQSLGDLLLNTGLFFWVIIYAWSKLTKHGVLIIPLRNSIRWVAAGISLSVLIIATFLFASLIQSLVADSKISFDVSDFFSLNIYTVYGFMIMTLLALSYYYLTQILFKIILPIFASHNFYLLVTIASAGLLYLTLLINPQKVLFYIPVLIWLLLYTLFVVWQNSIISKLKFSTPSFLLWIFIFSISLSLILITENQKAEWKKRTLYAEKLAVQTDPSSVRLLNIALASIDEKFLRENLDRLSDRFEGKRIRDSLLNINYTGYMNKYNTELFIFDSLKRPVNNENRLQYDELNTLITVQAVPTQIPDIFYAETSSDKFVYITRKEFYNEKGKAIGSVFILSNPKRFGSDALTPELFNLYEQNELENSLVYNYAIYDKRQIVSPISRYGFKTVISEDDIPKLSVEKRINGEYSELWYRASPENVVVISRKMEAAKESITLFSYLFCSFLFLTVIIKILVFIYEVVNNVSNIKRLFLFKIRTQIYNTIIFVSIFSFIVIGISIISFFVERYNKLNTDRLVGVTKTMVGEIQKQIAEVTQEGQVISLYTPNVNEQIKKTSNDISFIHGMDVNIYDLSGNLFTTSEENIYYRGVLSKKMEPMAFYQLSRHNLLQFSQEEHIGKLTYSSIYSPIRDENRNTIAYLNIPYFTSQPELNKEISDFLVTIINLNAFIFLIAGIIAFIITNRITHSFAIIGEKMKEVSLGKANEEIEITSEDEIGELVKHYNKMVKQLEESAVILAKSERELAWREMARQVAHEIKNPLTPMKLSLQYLQNAVRNDQANIKDLSTGVAATVVEQIDHLAKIAEDFTQFANIGNRVLSVFDINEVLTSLAHLYDTNEEVKIEWERPQEPIYIYSDRTHINRLFTNLILNAIQAKGEKEKSLIQINHQLTEGYITISIKDNGEGIKPEAQTKIFQPNFTTKSSGTGLGLAMCKGIVEQARGEIWFETERGEGTTFFVKLPIDVG